MTDDDHDFDLLIPFTCVQSVGGPFEDESFIAGIEFERISHTLNMLKVIGIAWYECYLRPALLKDVDLVAMHYGWSCRELDPPEETDLCDEHSDWVLVRFEIGETL